MDGNQRWEVAKPHNLEAYLLLQKIHSHNSVQDVGLPRAVNKLS
jgi:hypothetical protein